MGRSTTAMSPGITVDSTPPDVSTVPIDVGGPYMTERIELSARWKGVFDDAESGEGIVQHIIYVYILCSSTVEG